MQTIQPSYYRGYTFGFAKQAVKTFITWCKNQEDNRYGWLAVMIFIHGCVLTPASLFSIFFSGNSMLSLSFVIGAMGDDACEQPGGNANKDHYSYFSAECAD
ncbi:MAG: hypothetical protein WDO16_23680 [Bacteroidota bacterium]